MGGYRYLQGVEQCLVRLHVGNHYLPGEFPQEGGAQMEEEAFEGFAVTSRLLYLAHQVVAADEYGFTVLEEGSLVGGLQYHFAGHDVGKHVVGNHVFANLVLLRYAAEKGVDVVIMYFFVHEDAYGNSGAKIGIRF